MGIVKHYTAECDRCHKMLDYKDPLNESFHPPEKWVIWRVGFLALICDECWKSYMNWESNAGKAN